jgi:ubiquinone biosynthesis protein UbiJ
MKKNILALLSRALNAYLQLDAESSFRLQKLNNKVITIELLPLHFIFQCIFNDKAIRLEPGELLPAETKIRGTPLQMMNVLLDKKNRNTFFAEDIIIEGNTELGQHVVLLFDELQIDHEECLAHYIGDVPAYHVNRCMQGIQNWFKHTEHTFTQNMNEYVHEESGWLATNEALHDFFNDIDTLRMDVDRIEARVKELIHSKR